MEEFLAEGVLLFAVGNSIVGGEGLLEGIFRAADFLCQFLTGHLLHEAAAGVVAGVEVKDIGGFGVEDETDGPFLGFFLFPHFAGDVVAVAELVGETLTFAVKKKTAFAT